jgi:pyruvate/2-oxoglutarate dehydrogenase complex dihydrolipoamide acyltransferase (E2) component
LRELGKKDQPMRSEKGSAILSDCMRPLGGLWLTAFGLAAATLLAVNLAAAKPRAKPAPKAKPTAEAKPAPAPAEEEKPAPAEADTSVKAAGTKEAAKDPKAPNVTAVEESAKEKGVKTYKFSAVEVEGRLKSPQIIYFLRRVRAEFEAGDLGHRSFMPELSDTRRSPSLR